MRRWFLSGRVLLPAGALLAILAALGSEALSTSSPACGVAEAPRFLPLPTCKPTNKTLEDAAAVAWKFAPVVYPHPLERYHLQSPEVWFNASALFQQDFRQENESFFSWFDNSQLHELMFMPRSFRTVLNATDVSEEQRQELIAGAAFVNNRSTAKVHFSVEQMYTNGERNEVAPGLWLYTYHLYYSWNGCSNQDLAISLNGELQTLQYLLCPIGVHEGDWERVSVLVCAEDLTLQQAAYSQHSWSETRDCTAEGQCPRERNENDPTVFNPVAYSAFESHANYYEPSPLMVYAWRNATFGSVAQLDNLGGVWVGDRTLADPSLKFVPTPDNIAFLPNMSQIENQTGWEWAVYPGNWGAPLQGGKTSYECLSNNQTVLQACPDNSATGALKTAFKILDLANMATGGISSGAGRPGFDQQPFLAKEASNSSFVGAGSITGPLFRTYSYQWLPETSAPIYSDFKDPNAVVICPNDSIVTLPYPDYTGALSTTTSINTLVRYLVGMCVGSVIVSALFVLLMMVPSLLSHAVDAPARLMAVGSAAVASGREAVRKGGNAVTGGVASAGSTLRDLSTTAQQAQQQAPQADGGKTGADAVPATAAAAAVAAEASNKDGAGFDCGSAAPSPLPLARATAPSATSSKAELDLVLPDEQQHYPGFALWTVCAVLLYIAAVVTLSLGTEQFVSNSVAAYATNVINKSTAIAAVKWLIIGSLLLTALCDLFVLFIVLLAGNRRFQVWKWSVRNYLHIPWVHRHIFKIHIVTAGLVILVISLATILFGLGLVVMTVQLAARLACSTVANASVGSVQLSDVCVTVSSLAEDPICGWQALQVCYYVTNMSVLMISLGAILLLWAHIIFLVILLMSMWRYREWKVVVPRMQRDGSARSLGGGSDWNSSPQMGVAVAAGSLEKSGSGWGVEKEEGEALQGGGKGAEHV